MSNNERFIWHPGDIQWEDDVKNNEHEHTAQIPEDRRERFMMHPEDITWEDDEQVKNPGVIPEDRRERFMMHPEDIEWEN